MTRPELRRASALATAIMALHAVGFGALLLVALPRHPGLSHGGGLGLGLGLTAYTLGLRHAFDADHIAAIDNTTRRLMRPGRRPLGVGFFFSLGHATIVLAAALLLGLGVHVLGPGGGGMHRVVGALGAGVSGGFLYLIAAVNLSALAGILRVMRRMRRDELDEGELERQLEARGLANRLLGRVVRHVSRSWHMYPVGLLFGLGLDTASEVALLVLAAGAATGGVPLSAVVCLPVLFAAGMCLLDTIDGAFMACAYGWAFARPVRRIYYNLTVTALSVAVAFLVGSVELASIAADRLGVPALAWADGLDLNVLGAVIVALFVLTWVIALAVWRLARVEERWGGVGYAAAVAAPPDRRP